MTSDLTIQLIGVLSASACALIGVFLILRRSAMMADAISHAILPGIVLGYFLADGPSLLLGFLGAVLASTLTVTLVAALQRSRKVDPAPRRGRAGRPGFGQDRDSGRNRSAHPESGRLSGSRKSRG